MFTKTENFALAMVVITLSLVWILNFVGCEADKVEEFIQQLQDENAFVRERAAVELGNIGDALAVEPLIEALGDEDGDVRQAVVRALIMIGKEGTEPVLIKTLEKHGTKRMAEDFLNCGNPKLEEAATKWAVKHGYKIVTVADDDSGPGWGEA